MIALGGRSLVEWNSHVCTAYVMSLYTRSQHLEHVQAWPQKHTHSNPSPTQAGKWGQGQVSEPKAALTSSSAPEVKEMNSVNDPHSDGNSTGKKCHLGVQSPPSFGSRGATTCHSWPGPGLPFLVLFSSAIAAAQRIVFGAVQGVTHWELV